MKKIALASLAISVSLLSSCASITNGTTQRISVQTTPVQNAQCSLENNKGKWEISKTPGNTIVHKSDTDLIITCKKEGYQKAKIHVKSKMSKAVYGNLLVGGVIGGVIDSTSGAAFNYPLEVKVPLALKNKTK